MRNLLPDSMKVPSVIRTAARLSLGGAPSTLQGVKSVVLGLSCTRTISPLSSKYQLPESSARSEEASGHAESRGLGACSTILFC